MQDNETVLEYLLQRGEALKALAVLRRPGVSQELVYKFAPASPSQMFWLIGEGWMMLLVLRAYLYGWLSGLLVRYQALSDEHAQRWHDQGVARSKRSTCSSSYRPCQIGGAVCWCTGAHRGRAGGDNRLLDRGVAAAGPAAG